MLQMWMAGHGTSQISTQMNIKAKTVSSHKGNIKKKIQTHNKQVIYHIVRLTENITRYSGESALKQTGGAPASSVLRFLFPRRSHPGALFH
jgi:DNA-binding NarL/FixJ family response regulator